MSPSSGNSCASGSGRGGGGEHAAPAGLADRRRRRHPAPASKLLSAEDAELLKHLELLESFDEAKDLELLEELSVER